MQRNSVLAWGAGEDGQLGLGNLDDRPYVCEVEALNGHDVVSVVSGSRNSLAICKDGRLFTWGWNQRGTLGHPPDTKTESTPTQVQALVNVKIVQAAIGGWHCLAVDDKGCAYAWGGNEYGQCAEEHELKGENKQLRRDIVIPQRCAPHLSVRQVAAGGTHSVVLTNEGQVWTWGQQWPPGDIKQISTPVRVQGLEKVRLIAVGAFHNLALMEHGEVATITASLPIALANSEGDALYELRRGLDDPENVLQSWDPTLVNPCTWFHVTCNHNNRVTRLDLGNANLSGHLVPELGSLEHLQYLELYKNRISGKIPEELGKLKNLISLDLYSNNLTGSIPSSLGNLKSLVFLRLNKNKLTGKIPRSLTSISSLKLLDVSDNDLCGTIPTNGAFDHFSMKNFDNNPRLNGPELVGSVAYDSGCN